MDGKALHKLTWFAPAWNGSLGESRGLLQLLSPALVSGLVDDTIKQERKKRKYFLTLPSAPSSTPSSPSTISVETETPPEGCRCFCPSIFRSLNTDMKVPYYKTQHKPSFPSGKQQVHPLTTTTSSEFSEAGQSLKPTSKKVSICNCSFQNVEMFINQRTRFHLIFTQICTNIPIKSKLLFFLYSLNNTIPFLTQSRSNT